MPPQINFSDALVAIKNGHKISRSGWNGDDMFLELQVPDEHSKMTGAYIYINVPKGAKVTPEGLEMDYNRVPWVASQTDLLAEDWIVI